MNDEPSVPPVSYWVRRRREQDAVVADTGTAWTSFVENEASTVEGGLLEKRAS